jgi:hypothetical protein
MHATLHVKSLLLALLGFDAVLSVSATQAMHRPENYKQQPHKYAQGDATAHVIHKRSGAKVNSAYFTNWSVMVKCCLLHDLTLIYRGIYGANFRMLHDLIDGEICLNGHYRANRHQSCAADTDPLCIC